MMRHHRRRFQPLLVVMLAAITLTACEEEQAPPDFVARVGDRHLLRSELDRALRSIPVPQDSMEARQQIIEQWVTNELMYQEALSRGLRQDEEVQRQLEESQRAVLVNALLSHLYEENAVAPTPSEKQAYFESHKEQLRLRESFARVRYLGAANRTDAEAARRMLQQAAPVDRDSVWTVAINRYASDEALANEFSTSYYPESRVFIDRPALREALASLLGGQLAPVIDSEGVYHVIQLVDRVPSRTIPEPAWIDEELVRRLVIQGRKQLYARQVQRLRNEALAREDLEIR